jgi:8-oxo-dGTP pyrophosphatase MutT (NUDIX family)
MHTLKHIREALAKSSPAVHSDEPGSRAAVAIILREPVEGWGAEVLFIQRAEDPRDPWSGHMAFPGGRKDDGDVDLRATTEREVSEEIGFDLRSHATLLCQMPDLPAIARGRRVGLVITPFVYALESHAAPESFVLSDEVASTHWSQIVHLNSKNAAGSFDYLHEGHTIRLPCIYLENRKTVWGLTYQMLLSFFQKLRVEGM